MKPRVKMHCFPGSLSIAEKEKLLQGNSARSKTFRSILKMRERAVIKRRGEEEMAHNNNCDGTHCWAEDGEVRVLPLGGGGNLILCRSCFEYEIRYRKERNKELGTAAQFDLPVWESLKVYKSGE